MLPTQQYNLKALRLNIRQLLVPCFFIKATSGGQIQCDTAISLPICGPTNNLSGSASALSGCSASITQISPHTPALFLTLLTAVCRVIIILTDFPFIIIY